VGRSARLTTDESIVYLEPELSKLAFSIGSFGQRLLKTNNSRFMFGKAGRAMNLRVPHPLRSLQRVGIRESLYRDSWIPPFAKNAKDGAPADSWRFLPNAVSSPVGRRRRWRLKTNQPSGRVGTSPEGTVESSPGRTRISCGAWWNQ
jgi:hypothetical protein